MLLSLTALVGMAWGLWGRDTAVAVPPDQAPPSASVAAQAAPEAQAPQNVAAAGPDPDPQQRAPLAPEPRRWSPPVAAQNPGSASAALPELRRKQTRAPEFLARRLDDGALESAYAALLAGRLDEARRLYQERLTAQPDDRDALLGLAYIAHRSGQREAAIDYYQRALRQDPDQAQAQAGLLMLQGGTDLLRAASRAQDSAERHPQSAATLAALGATWVGAGRWSDAALLFARAQNLEPGNATHAYNLAVCLDHLHRYGQAQAQYQRALQLATQTPDAAGSGFERATVLQRLVQLRAAAADGQSLQP